MRSPSNDNASADESRKLITLHVAAPEFCVDIMGIREIRGWTAAEMLDLTHAAREREH